MFRLLAATGLSIAALPALAQTAPAPAPTPSAAPVAAAAEAPLPPAQAAIRAHVMFLASDAMNGREAGTRDYDIAAAYVAAQFYAAGLKPAGDNGTFLQRVPLVGYRIEEGATAAVTRGTARTPLTLGTDFLPSANLRSPRTDVSAPVVFAGYGIVHPARGRDDLAGLDVRGKIVAVVSGAPAGMTGEEQAMFGSSALKARIAKERGAIGVIVLATPRTERLRPFARSADHYRDLRMTWARADGSPNVDEAQAPVLATLSLAGAEKLFAGARTPWSKVSAEAAKTIARFRGEALPATFSVTSAITSQAALSANVAGMLPGSDPALAGEVVVLTAHLDHIGVSKPVNGDAINNGALDNAIGIASLIEEAKRFRTAGAPKRSILFLAVTAEEKGLVGSDYFANNPTVPAGTIVANVNLDMPILTYPFTDVVAFGGDRSTLGPIIAEAARGIGVTLSPDPIPEEGIFLRSDHFRFVQKGIPSVFLWPGYGGQGAKAAAHFLATHYHKPSDDLSMPILWDQAERFVEVNYRIARGIADAPSRPVWNRGDLFGTMFNGPMAR
jgi:Zn-dependent M28 family amino/carboxypeptidase